MSRYIAVIVASLILASAAAVASVSTIRAHPSTNHRAGWIARHANTQDAWVYVGGRDNNLVSIYDVQAAGMPQVGEITAGISAPGGVSIDGAGNVYVANQATSLGSGDVTIYPPDATSPSLTLTAGLTDAVSIAVASDGDVYVSNRGNPSDIVVYPAGQTKPSKTITSGLIQVPTQIVLDSAGDLYVADNDTGILEIPAGSQQPVSLGLQNIPLSSGLAIDPTSGDLFVGQAGTSWASRQRVQVFVPGNDLPVRSLRKSAGSDMLAVGAITSTEYLFVPHVANGTVLIYNTEGRNPIAKLSTNARYLVAIGFKPGGVP